MGYYRDRRCAGSLATSTTPGLVRLSDLENPGDLTKNSIGVSAIGAIRLIRAILSDEMSKRTSCSVMRRIFEGATVSPDGKIVLACANEPVVLDIPTGTITLDLLDTSPEAETAFLTLIDQMEEQYALQYPDLVITTP